MTLKSNVEELPLIAQEIGAEVIRGAVWYAGREGGLMQGLRVGRQKVPVNDRTLTRLQKWYLSQCNGDWEHTYGIRLDNLDNPGWSLKVDLADTSLEGRVFTPVEIQRKEEHDWVHCRATPLEFNGFCGPQNLEEMLLIFLDWAEAK